MQTATSIVRNPSGESSTSVHMIIDSSNQRTYVTERLAKDLKLKLDPLKKLAVVALRSNQPKQIQLHTKFQLTLRNGYTNMFLDVSVVSMITGRVRCVPLCSEVLTFLSSEGLERIS